MATLDIWRVLICQIQNNQQMAMIKQYVFLGIVYWNCVGATYVYKMHTTKQGNVAWTLYK